MSKPENHARLTSDRVLPERSPRIFEWHIPLFLQRALPQKLVDGLRELKGRFVTRGLPRHVEFEQSPEDGQASASMSIVVPIHDAPAVTRRCLASLHKYAPESEIILVDDASNLTETVEVIQDFARRNGWKVVRNEKALGHSEACRSGANLATRPYLCLLNSDTVVTPWCWRRIKDAFEQDQNVGVAGPSTSNSGTRQEQELAKNLGLYWNDNQICAFAERLLADCQDPVVLDLPWVSGFAFFIRRSLWEQIGGFDQKLPDYGNEVELCNRVAANGYRMAWIRNSYIHHFGQQSYRNLIGDEGVRARIRDVDFNATGEKSSTAP
jgi:GT2 family glycosyltransferase